MAALEFLELYHYCSMHEWCWCLNSSEEVLCDLKISMVGLIPVTERMVLKAVGRVVELPFLAVLRVNY